MSGISALANQALFAWQQPFDYRNMWATRTSTAAVNPYFNQAVSTPQSLAAPAGEAEGTGFSSIARSAATTAASFPETYPELRLPTEEDLENASEWMVRMNIQYPGQEEMTPLQAAMQGKLAGLENELAQKETEGSGPTDKIDGEIEDPESPAEVMEEAECQTCARRKYQDGSDDPGVSFKNPTNLSPEEAASAVRGHEQEHVVRERAKAEQEGRRVVNQTVTIHTDICPECGRVYVSGGTTRTVTANDLENELSYQPDEESGKIA